MLYRIGNIYQYPYDFTMIKGISVKIYKNTVCKSHKKMQIEYRRIQTKAGIPGILYKKHSFWHFMEFVKQLNMTNMLVKVSCLNSLAYHRQ